LPGIWETAIQRAQGNLLRLQKPEGYWVGELMVDSTIVSDTVAYHHWNARWTRNGSARRSITSSPCIVRRRLEHLLRRSVGRKRHHQGPTSRSNSPALPVTDPRMLKAREIGASTSARAAA